MSPETVRGGRNVVATVHTQVGEHCKRTRGLFAGGSPQTYPLSKIILHSKLFILHSELSARTILEHERGNVVLGVTRALIQSDTNTESWRHSRPHPSARTTLQHKQ